MIFPDGTVRPWTPDDLPLRDDCLYDDADTVAMSNLILKLENERVLAEMLAKVDDMRSRKKRRNRRRYSLPGYSTKQ